ncbi:hypothetical protein [Mycobacteroides abscessus]|uniref:hypothetical protein n=1 Tax=Mycobacteroides abscessus TaxID=36809 RepID=UPI0009A5F39B|nr:hypothetical protein [Mycobacteroides abscessus]SLH41133.1 Uncharacterised protein [Mycobacteroides abscessus subsp. massiliense]
MIPTTIELPAVAGEVANAGSNVATTASEVVSTTAPAIVPAPAGTDEASALASLNVGANTADLLGTAASDFAAEAEYVAALAHVAATSTATDAANSGMFGGGI